MGSHYIQVARGLRKVSAIITVAAAATPENLYLISTGFTAATVILRKIMCYSNVGNCVVDIGIGLAAAFANIIPSIYVVNLFDTSWPEDDLPEVEVNANLTVQSSILGVMVQVEVEEVR